MTWMDGLSGGLRRQPQPPQTELPEFHRAGINRDSYADGSDSKTCVFGGCVLASRWRFLIGDVNEHIARLCYCDAHAIFVAYARSHQCTACGQPMRIEVREKM